MSFNFLKDERALYLSIPLPFYTELRLTLSTAVFQAHFSPLFIGTYIQMLF